jgi:transcriptional regulator with XRE-family HTH domain
MLTLAQRVQMALDANPGIRQADLARACNVTTASVSNWLTGQTLTMKASSVRLAAELLGCDPRWLETGQGLPNWRNQAPLAQESPPRWTVPEPPGQRPSFAPLAHQLRQASTIVLPTPLEWDVIMSGSALPSEFMLRISDAALEPRFAAGTRFILSRNRPSHPGDVVLVRDASGHFYLREYRAGRASRWQAAALSPAFATLDSEDDGLQVVACALGALWAEP